MIRGFLALPIVMAAVSAPCRADTLDEQIKQQQAEVQAARAALQPLIAQILVPDSDLRIWLAGRMLDMFADAYNHQANHTFQFQATGEDGKLVNSSGGALGCGWYVEVQDGTRATGSMTLTDFSAHWTSSGAQSMGAKFGFHSSAQIHGHVNGPAGPCSFWDLWPTCDCQIGGGFGSSVGTTASGGGDFASLIRFTSSAAQWLGYDISLISPSSIPVHATASLQYLGDVPIDQTVPIPTGVVASGSVAPVFENSGSLKLGQPPVLEKNYQLVVTPLAAIADSSGFAVKAHATITFR